MDQHIVCTATIFQGAFVNVCVPLHPVEFHFKTKKSFIVGQRCAIGHFVGEDMNGYANIHTLGRLLSVMGPFVCVLKSHHPSIINPCNNWHIVCKQNAKRVGNK